MEKVLKPMIPPCCILAFTKRDVTMELIVSTNRLMAVMHNQAFQPE